MSSEWSAVPRGVLGDDLDGLLAEREDLQAKTAAAYHQGIESEKAIGPARAADRELFATALRANKPDPGDNAEQAALKAHESAKRSHEACRAALNANQSDVLAVIEMQGSDILKSLQTQLDEIRTNAQRQLDELSQSLTEFRGKQALVQLVTKPLAPNGETLIRFNPDRPLQVPFNQRRDEAPTASKLLQAIEAVLEVGAPSPAAHMLAAHEAGLQCNRLERYDIGALRWAKLIVPNIKQIGLVRYRIIRGSYALDLLVSVEHDAANDLASILRGNRDAITEAFARNRRHVVGDQQAIDVLESLVLPEQRLVFDKRLPEPQPAQPVAA